MNFARQTNTIMMNAAVELPCFKQNNDTGLSSSLISSDPSYAPCNTNSCSRGQTEWSLPSCAVGSSFLRFEKVLLACLLAMAVCLTGLTSVYYMKVHAKLNAGAASIGYDVEIIPGRTSDTTLARINHEVDALCATAGFASCFIQSFQYTCNCEIADYSEQWTWKVTMPKAKVGEQLYRVVWYDGDGKHKRMTWKKAIAFKEAKQN